MSESVEEKERRAAERLSLRGTIATFRKLGFLSSLLSRKAPTSPMPVRNITSSGICILTEHRVRPGQRLLMTIRLGERGPSIQIEAKVVWCEKGKGTYAYRAGVRFVDFKGDAWRVLSRLGDYASRRDDRDIWRLHSKSRRRRAEGEQAEPEPDRQR